MIRSGQQTGYILLPVIVVITLVAAIALLMNTESALESNTTGSELDAQQTQYVAEAGLNHALWLARQQGCGPYGNLTDEPLGNDKYTSNLTTDLGSTTVFTISVDQDSWIRSDQPTVNHGTNLKLHTRNEAAGTERPLLRYDLSPIVAKASILSATAWFYVTNAHAAGPIDIHLTSADWAETDATWNSMSLNMDSAVLATIPSQPVNNVWIPVNLTAQVQAWVNGQPNYGITLNAPADGVHGQYDSRESAKPPYLEVIVGAPPSSPAVLKVVGTLANGVTRDITRSDVTLVQHPAGFSLLRVTTGSGQDAMLDSFYSSRNFGNHELKLEVRSTYQNSLIQFELPAIPPGARILSAQLELYHYLTSGTPVDPGADVHRVTRSWIEGTKSGSGTADGASWDTWDGSSNWTSAGGDYDATPVASSAISAATGDWESWEISELVQGWIDGRFPNHGLFLKGTGSIDDISFASKEDADPALHPKLSITYTCTCGEVCAEPQGSGKIALIGDDSSPDPDDQLKIKIIESWGYQVDFYQDGNSSGINWSNYDLAYVSETVISGDVSANLANLSIGVVNEEPKLYDDLGLASGDTEHVGSSIDIVDNGHFITSIFPQGPLPIYAADMEILTANTPLAPGLQTLGEFGGAVSLAVLDQGAPAGGDIAGENAAGRRVMLPLGQHFAAGFDWTHLNSNGRLIVQRAIEWGMNKSVAANQLLIISTDNDATLGGSSFTGNDLAEYDLAADSASLFFDGSLTTLNEDITAVHVLTNGHLVLGAKDTTTLGGISFEAGDLIDYDPVADSATLIFDGSALFTDPSEKIMSVYVMDNGHLVLSTDGDATLGSLSFTDKDLVEYDPATDNASLFFDGSSTTLDEDIDAVHVLTDGHIVLSTKNPATLGGISFEAGDLVDYDPVADSATLLFDGSALFTDPTEKIKSAHIGAGSGTIAVVPVKVLFVVADNGALTAAETAKKVLIESWGYFVNLIDDDDTVANFVAAIAANDVAYISGEVSDTAVGTKLTNAAIGVVNEQIALHDELLLSTSAGTNDFNRIFIIDNTHYITEGIPTGWHTIATSDQPLNALEGTLAPGMTNLAEVWISGANYDFGLAVVDIGGELNGGEFAADRRVQIPWGTASFDFNALNDNGKDLMRRAIEWGIGVDITGPIAHWKLDDGAGLTAIDSEGGHDGTLTNPPAWVAGTIGGALDFDGSDDYVDLTSDSELDDVFDGGATAMAWIKPEGWGENGYGRIFDKSSSPSSTGDGWVIRMNVDNGGIINFGQGFIGGRGWWKIPNASISLDTWQHIAIAYDASSTANDPVIYLDGSPLLVTEADTPSGDLRSDASINLRLGNYAGGTTHTFDGIIDDARIYDRMLSAAEIADIAAAGGGGGGPSYTELHQPWSATSNDTWQTVDLGAFGVPVNAVVEVAVVNSNTSRENFGGVRAVGSSLERRFALHEVEGGGVDAVTMHVQADASSQIQHYADRSNDVSFVLLGYWTGATYVERFDAFKAGANASWQSHDLSAYGVGANQVAEISMLQTSTSIEWLVGARRSGSGLMRRISLHEAESGGVDMVSLMVESDASSLVEVYAEANSVIDFHLLGYWSTPPGTYTETGGVHGQASAASTWEPADLTGFGVPANAVAQFVISNEIDNFQRELGIREVGSSRQRVIELQEAESGGGDLGTMHVNVDSASSIEWYSASGTTERFFYPVGWWVLSP